MEFSKPPLTFEEQADILIKRGMNGDRDFIVCCLRSVSYYRLSGYWRPFRRSCDTFKSGIHFNTVWQRYVFDRQLRIHVMDAVERIEIAVRTQLTYYHAHEYQAFGYATDSNALPGMNEDQLQIFLERIKEEQNRSQETFVKHFREKYGDCHDYLPVWMATEVMAFGSVLSFYRGVGPAIQKKIACFFGIPDVVLDSWLLALNTVRNICAHHGRLWNRELGTKPKMPYPRKHPDWQIYNELSREQMFRGRIFLILTICRYCLSIIAPQSQWPQRLLSHLRRYPDIPCKNMGFPSNWREFPFWNNLDDT